MSGNLLWLHDSASYALTRSRLYMPSLIHDNKLISITTAGDLVILNGHNGAELAQVNLATSEVMGDGSLSKGPMVSPMLDGNDLYVLLSGGELIKIDLANGEIKWRQNFVGAKSFWIAGNVSYLLTADHQLLAIENKAGQLIWAIDVAKDLEKKKKVEFYGPILAGDKLIITASNGDFFYYSPHNGSLISINKNKTAITQMPIITNDKMYLIGNKGQIAVWQ